MLLADPVPLASFTADMTSSTALRTITEHQCSQGSQITLCHHNNVHARTVSRHTQQKKLRLGCSCSLVGS